MVVDINDIIPALPVYQIANLRKLISSTSKGNQEKWYEPDTRSFLKAPFYCSGRYWRDYICEAVAYQIGTQLGFDMAVTKMCTLQFKDGSSSLGSCFMNFLELDEVFIPLADMLDSARSNWLTYRDLSTLSVSGRISEIRKVCQDICKIDVTKYLLEMITLDFLIGNEDRHLNNFGVILNQHTQRFRTAPHFNNGLSLLEHDSKYFGMTLEKCIPCIEGQPFSSDLRETYTEAVVVLGSNPVMICNLNGIVFPSFKAFSYFKYASDILNIPVLGEAGWLNAEER